MEYIEKLVEDCRLAKMAKPTKTFTFKDMDDLKTTKSAVYIIEEVGGDIVGTHEAFAKYRKEDKNERKCSKLNKKPSPVLYVGSSTTGIKKRIGEHLGDGNASTYALNLQHWFLERKMKITIREYDVSRDVLQIIEDSISYDLSPAFGKSGGNGR
jgi:hypothetical protein